MSIGYFIGETEELRELVKCWQTEQKGSEFGLDLQVGNAMSELEIWRQNKDAAVIVQTVNDKIVGFLCIFCIYSPLLNRRVAIEKYWYVLPEHRRSGIKMLYEARTWAKQNNCTHLIMVASELAGDMYSKACKLFDRFGMKLFETTFIAEV